ncbi:acyltransferase [Arthrobacter sp. N199823]|uniref:acyltransferase n=1 Tax=Arthrobacter sp. N199823 TaxID=2058895 RepID=UPI000CE48B0E|nr:acyltransferase family protein [Arthrobacter sp. N199823]
MPARQRIEYFDVLRAIAIVAVVVLHTAASRWYSLPSSSTSWQALNIYDSIVRFCVPIFFMISGALFLRPEQNITIRSMMRKSIPRLLLAFGVWSIFYVAWRGFGPTGFGSPKDAVAQLVLGYYHLWFIYALIGLYLVTPLLRKIVADRAMAWYFVALAAVFASFLPMLVEVPVLGPVVAAALDKAQLHLVLGYSMFFVLGHLLNTVALSRAALRWCLLGGLAGIAITALGTFWLSSVQGKNTVFFYQYLTPNVVIVAVAVFCAAKYWGERYSMSARWRRVIGPISAYSFGIYMVHPFFQELLAGYGINSALLHPVFSVPMVAVAILIPSFLAAAVVRRIPKVGAYIA